MKSIRTKIIATIGPASASTTTLTRMMHAGMRIARLNFSHGTHEEHAEYIRQLRKAERRFGRPVAILQDLQGPKIRIGELAEPVTVHTKESVSFIAESKHRAGDGHVPVTHELLYKDVQAGHRLFIDDGILEFEVTQVRGKIVHARAVHGGEIGTHKGINLPDSRVTMAPLSEKDYEDMAFGLAQGVDLIALSFVQDAYVIEEARKAMKAICKRLKRPEPGLIAKIETRSGVDHIEEIITGVDGILIARGDLALEVSFEEVPVLQKELVDLCRSVGVPSIVATQMLDSMTHHPRATRAEISDVANAVFDHADAVMLSQETAIGDFPEASVQTMAMVIQEAEDSHIRDPLFIHSELGETIALAIAQSVATMAYHEQIQAITIPSSHPDVLLAVNHYRPNCPIFVTCNSESEFRPWLLHTSVEPVLASDTASTYLSRVHSLLRKSRHITSSDRLAMVTAQKPNHLSLTIR